jgi:phospholipid/cholesterol/gamma-HCH transport system substrate-binding protein
MEKDARYFIVGLLVSIGLITLVMFIIWLAGAQDTKNREIYTVYFTDPVSGLNKGASVQYRGVDVGKVLDIRLSKNREDLIKVNIAVDDTTPIRATTQATLAMLGITGLVYVELTTEPGDVKAPQRIQGEEHPVLQGSGTQVAKILQDIPKITQEILQVAEKLNQFFDAEHTELLSQTLKNTESLSRDLNGLLSEDNVRHASETMENFSQISADAKDIADRFEQTANEIEEAVRALNDMVSSNQANVNRFTGEGLQSLTRTTKEAEKTVESIRSVTDQLRRDPSQIIYRPNSNGVEIEK